MSQEISIKIKLFDCNYRLFQNYIKYWDTEDGTVWEQKCVICESERYMKGFGVVYGYLLTDNYASRKVIFWWPIILMPFFGQFQVNGKSG